MRGKIIKLLLGTGVGQVVQLASLPIIARLFSSEALGFYAVGLSFSTIAAVVMGGRLEYLLPKSSRADVQDISRTSIILILFLTLILFFLLWLGVFNGVFQAPISAASALVFSFLSASFAFYNFSVVLMAVDNKITELSFVKGGRGASASILQVASGMLGILGSIVLPLIDAVTRLASCYYQVKVAALGKINVKIIFVRQQMLIMFSSVVNVCSVNIPALFFSAIWGVKYAGFYFLVQRVVGGPMALMGQSLSSAYVSEIAGVLKGDNSKVWVLTKKIVVRSALYSLPLFVLVGVVGYKFVDVIFGAQWSDFAFYWLLLTPSFFLQFCFSPVSQTLSYLGGYSWQAGWEVFRLALLLLVFGFVYAFELGFEYAILAFTLVLLLTYVFLFYKIKSFCSIEIMSGSGDEY